MVRLTDHPDMTVHVYRGRCCCCIVVLRPLPPPPVILLLAAPRRLFCFGSLVVLDVVCGYVLLFLLDMKIKKIKIDV